MNIGFIGAGKVGTAFGKYLVDKGFEVEGYYSRSQKSSEKAAAFTNSRAYYEASELTRKLDIIFITTNDDEIERVCDNLVQDDLLKRGQVVIHMSGAASSKILDSAKRTGCFTYSVHPLQAFADIEKAVQDLPNTVFSIEGDEEKIDVVEKILKTTGNGFFNISSEQKTIYHATACVLSNYFVTLMDYGLSLFEAIGIDGKEGYKAMYPLIEGTMKNIHELGTEKALTGPIARGDVNTIEKHVESIGNMTQDKLDFYKLMGDMTLSLAKKDKLDSYEKIKELQNILRGE
ncbi:Rossmann-like and DUF2520 domain-containing protein [Wukongibacter baidiensis]|uniref:Rossmann-like and DUF2520 domain-containing protein n=1 Tax=Wukongibacter baidiensis TaxID=1723361 RepID=UPI003D7F8E2C